MMKKIIALALALSMALSMVAFAGYTDAALINEDLTADVDLVKALGLMTGNPDGSFNPQGTLTRGEAAVIIYRLKSGKTDIDASWGDASLNTFTDMADHWSAKYVNYCAALGLITGNPDGTFRPDNAVTGVEMAKMLLNVAGYDTEKQQYGPKWPAAVLADAGDSGLLEGYEAAFTAPAAREWVAAMVANLLDVQTVSYNAYTNALVKNTKNDEPVLFGEQYGVKTAKAFALANKTAAMNTGAKESDYSKVRVTIDEKTTKEVDIDFNVSEDLLGHDVVVYYKGSELNKDSKVYAVMDNAKSVTVTTVDKIKWDGTSKLTVNGTVVSEEVKTLNQWQSLAKPGAFITSDGKATNDYREVVVVENADDRWDLFVTKTTYTTVTKNDADKTTFTSAVNVCNTTDEEAYGEIVFNGTIEEGDVVMIETLADGTYVVSELATVRTKLTSVSGTTIVAGGTTYKKGVTLITDSAALPTDASGIKNKTYDVYTDGKYYVFLDLYEGEEEVDGLNMNVAYLIAGQKGDSGNAFTQAVSDKVQVMFSDGTIAVYEYDGSSTAIDFDFAEGKNAGTVYEYVLNDDGTISFYKAEATNTDKENPVAAIVTTAPEKFTKATDVNKSYLTIKGESTYFVYANADSFFFVKQTYVDEDKDTVTKYTVVTAAEIEANITADAVWSFGGHTAYTIDKSGLNTLKYGVLIGDSTKASDTGSASSLPVKEKIGAFVITTDKATATLTADGTSYTVPVINADGTKVTLTLTTDQVDNADKDNAIKTRSIYALASEGDDVYLATWDGNGSSDAGSYNDLTASASNLVKGEWHLTTISAATDKLIVLADGAIRDITADVNVLVINKGHSTSSTALSAGSIDEIPHDEFVALVKLDSNGKVTDIVLGYKYNSNDKDYDHVSLGDVIDNLIAK